MAQQWEFVVSEVPHDMNDKDFPDLLRLALTPFGINGYQPAATFINNGKLTVIFKRPRA